VLINKTLTREQAVKINSIKLQEITAQIKKILTTQRQKVTTNVVGQLSCEAISPKYVKFGHLWGVLASTHFDDIIHGKTEP